MSVDTTVSFQRPCSLAFPFFSYEHTYDIVPKNRHKITTSSSIIMKTTTKLLLALPHLLLIIITCTATGEEKSSSSSSPTLQQRFDQWAESNQKTYSTDSEKAYRFSIWRENDSFISNHNNAQEKKSWTLGHNEYSDMTNAEFREYFHLDEDHSNSLLIDDPDTLLLLENEESYTAPMLRHQRRRVQNVPKHVNWINEDMVTHVKNQGQCGSCWAFSAVAVMESYRAIHYSNLQKYEKVTLSEQQLVECSLADGGCNGGWPKNAMKYVYENGGMCTDAEYPYIAEDDGACTNSCTKVNGTDIPKPTYVKPRQNAMALMAAVALNPVSVVMDSGTQDFQFYAQGIYDGDCTTDYNHAVTIVGYGEVDGKEFWIVKNSWGTKWGDDGYFHIVRDSTEDAVPGKCAILKFGTTIPPKL